MPIGYGNSAYGFGRGRGFGGSLKMRVIIALVIGGMGLIGYFTSFERNPVTGEMQAVGLSAKQEIALGLQAAPEMIQQMGGTVPASDPASRLVRDVGQRLAAVQEVAGSPYAQNFEFHLLNDSQTVNAFALPGGQIFITRALLNKLENEAQLAGVLGHEIGHVIHRHGAQRMAGSKLAQSVATGVGVAASDGSMGGEIARQAAQYASGMLLLRYGREDELESDSYGLKLMAAAGFDPREMIGVMKILAASTGDGPRSPQWASSHPNPESRVTQIQEWIDQHRDELARQALSKGRTLRQVE